jgi:hypothetical protein
MATVAKNPRRPLRGQPRHGFAASRRLACGCAAERSDTMRELTVTVVVRVQAQGDDDEATARLVEQTTLRALTAAGLDPISGGYGFKPGP